MAINEQIVTGRKFRKCIDVVNKVWQRISFWTMACDVEFADGENAEDKLGGIKEIVNELKEKMSSFDNAKSAIINSALGKALGLVSSTKWEQVVSKITSIANRGTYNTTITSTNGITLPAGYYAGGTIKVSDNFAFVGSNFTCNFGSGEVATAFKDTDTLIPFPSISSQTSNLISVTGTQINALAAIPASQLTITISVRHTDEVMGGTPNVTLKAYKSGSLISTLDLATGMYSAWVTHTITINIPAMSKGQYVYMLFSYEGKATQAQIKSAKLTWTN